MMFKICNISLKSIKEMKDSNQKIYNKIIKYFSLDIQAKLTI